MAYNGNKSGSGYGAGGSNGNGSNGFARPSEFKIKEQLCDVGRRIWLKGFCAGNEGNHSYRLSEDRVLVTPTGISKGFLKPDDICTMDLDGKQVAGKRKRSSEALLHLAIYKARPEIKAVIHSHPPHATAFAVAGVDLPTCIHPEAEVFLGPVRTAKYVTPGDTRLGESILPYVKDSNTIILQNHGTVSFDTDLEQCYYKLEIVDAYARILILAKQVGSIKPMSGTEMAELLSLKAKFGLNDPRSAEAKAGNVSCGVSDFMSRVGGEVGSRGRMTSGGQTGPVAPPASAAQGGPGREGQGHQTLNVSGSSPMEQAIASMLPRNYNEADVEQLVQVITDQIMASVS